MKASLEHIDNAHDTSFLFKEFRKPYFDAPYHFHPEFELTLIVKSDGKRFVGNQVNDFQAGDLVLLGSDLPHCWQNNHFSNDEEAAQSIVIQFKEDFIGEKFFQSPEAKPIRDLLQNAKCGIQITGKTRDRIAKEIQFLLHASPFQRLLGLLDLLNTIANSNDIQLIDKQQGVYNLSQIDLKRINKVYAYVISHYTQEVHLD